MDHETLTPLPGADLRPRVFDSISRLLPRVLGRELSTISEDMKLMSELGMRSASMLELLLEIEDDLDIQIEVEDIDDAAMTSVGDLADFVASHATTDG
jgi:acyl carrier protein